MRAGGGFARLRRTSGGKGRALSAGGPWSPLVSSRPVTGCPLSDAAREALQRERPLQRRRRDRTVPHRLGSSPQAPADSGSSPGPDRTGAQIPAGRGPDRTGKPVPYAFLGPEGTFTEAALLAFDPGAAGHAMPCVTIQATLDAVRHGLAEQGIVPIENSVEGAVTATLDELATGQPW